MIFYANPYTLYVPMDNIIYLNFWGAKNMHGIPTTYNIIQRYYIIILQYADVVERFHGKKLNPLQMTMTI